MGARTKERVPRMSDDRRLQVLRAIVEDYVATQEPVGSRSLLERHDLGVSPATVRNDMTALEDDGMIAQPHTSAGRIPTDKGYRVFVDRIATVKPLSVPERRAIETFMSGAVSVDDVISRSVRILAQLTNQVAIVQYPSLTRSTVRHIELVALGGGRIMLVVITSSGRVEQRVVELGGAPTDELVDDMRDRITAACANYRLPEAAFRLSEAVGMFATRDQPIVSSVVTTLSQIFSDEGADERVAVTGAANLARYGSDFESSIRPILEAIEEQVVLLRLLGEATSDQRMQVRIGAETGYETLAGTSVVSTSYGAQEQTLATLGTMGPTRMDYPGTMAAVAAVARYIGRALSEGEGHS